MSGSSKPTLLKELRIKAITKASTRNLDDITTRFQRVQDDIFEEFRNEKQRLERVDVRTMTWTQLEDLRGDCLHMQNRQRSLVSLYEDEIVRLKMEISELNNTADRISRLANDVDRELEFIAKKEEERRQRDYERWSKREESFSYSPKAPITKTDREDWRTDNERRPVKRERRTAAMNDDLIKRTFDKVVDRVRMSHHRVIYDSDEEGWDYSTFRNTINGQGNLMFIVCPTYYEPFGCFMFSNVNGTHWCGEKGSFIFCLAEERFFWVYKSLSTNHFPNDIFKLGEPDDDFLFKITHYITLQRVRDNERSGIDPDIRTGYATRKGNFIGSKSSEWFNMEKFIVIQFN